MMHGQANIKVIIPSPPKLYIDNNLLWNIYELYLLINNSKVTLTY